MKTEVVICLGSSCFSRGNKKTVNLIKAYIQDHQLGDKVYFHGSHCFGNGENGPMLRINDQTFEHVTPENVLAILDSIFMNQE